ncbi:hypothetical protein K443DRAFT_130206 [Laccaria amethystina LaAM-08-1]|uniref:Uncharacterized protein n=1 Tax=Laccaria amethystina LaAM-08-1 TaxID=1095629 RepID=A0A0C9X106_9AGAR|nr:hypothetical protein K443DRAFT_130206 [Laccaria amethystina LaAM-08-1]
MSNNPTSINGYGTKHYPDNKTLKAALHQYAKEKLSTTQCFARLKAEHNLTIKFMVIAIPSKLYQLNTKFKVPSSCKPPHTDIANIATQDTLEKVADDPSQGCGVGTIQTLLSNEGMLLPRHKKLNTQAFNMGRVGLNLYGIKHQWSSFVLHLVIVPNNQLTTTIGHVHLDCIEKHKLIPVTFVTDKGSDTGYIIMNQTDIKVHNTPIEGLWHWFLQKFGVNISEIICSIYKIHPQQDKTNKSGATPRHAFTIPASPAQDCHIEVDQPRINALCLQIPVSQADSMCWVDEEFEEAAFDIIKNPSLDDIQLEWSIFSSIACSIDVPTPRTEP